MICMFAVPVKFRNNIYQNNSFKGLLVIVILEKRW